MKTLQEINKEQNGAAYKENLAALVDNRLKSLDFELFNPHHIEFVDYAHPDGRRTYLRSLSFLLQRAVVALFPEATLRISFAVANSLYCDLVFPDARAETDQDMAHLEAYMHRMVEKDIPFTSEKLPTDQAVAIFQANGRTQKALLQKTRGHFYTSVYYLDGYADTFYGPLVPSTGYLSLFRLVRFHNGFLLQYPMPDNKTKLDPTPKLHKLTVVFEEYIHWANVIKVKDIGSLNQKIQEGNTKDLILISEALHGRRYAAIADMIYVNRKDVKLVLIAGPSSSGKTTTSNRIANQLRVLGMNPIVLEMDNYFHNREDTPRDANGEFDFECLGAMDVPFLNRQLKQLLNGETVEIPKFDFKKGVRTFDGTKLTLGENEVLIMEGIHGLNPALTADIPAHRKFKVYASALTSLAMDETNRISTTDTRMIRRMVRDAKHRGTTAEETILRWYSISRGERQNIFPYQEEADVMFNSAMPYEISVLKYYAEPLLRQIPPRSPAYPDALRLLNFLSYFTPIHPEDEKYIPYTSVLREFIS